ncbi:urease accessory protein UreD [Oerskovia gallyi]|uniref:Urease accessory protein UreD n=1 Tax=Oerskovia gallyi TaxID=2762226 RepID=A0ABR8UZB3_9CELL|nr:urease accessory protein UreD [Oerskovia gallyi]MBD7997581.1 urease accessory protein UreD [Oerskovia gallyi]
MSAELVTDVPDAAPLRAVPGDPGGATSDGRASSAASTTGAGRPGGISWRGSGSGYGGYRLEPPHYEPERVPQEVLRHSSTPDTLAAGSPGKVGLLELEFARNDRGTELVHHYQKSPLQIMRPLYYDPLRPDMPYTYLMSTGGGILQADRLRTDLLFGPGSSAHVTTSAHSKVYRMEHDYAVAQTNVVVAEDAYVEYLPEPVIPFADSRFYQRTCVTLHESGTLVAGETVFAGRLARDERHRYAVFASDFEVRRPDGRIVALDRVRLVPEDGRTGGLAVLGDRDVLAMLYVLTPLVPPTQLADLLHSVLAERFEEDLFIGVSALPGDAGVWVRIVGDDTGAVASANTVAWRAVHQVLTGIEAPLIRKS